MSETIQITGYNQARTEDALILYTGTGRTGTNPYGWEACVLNGRVILCGHNNSEIPENGFVISGHGKAAEMLSGCITPGVKVTVDNEQMLLKIDKDQIALQMHADLKIAEIEKRLSERIADGEPFDREEAEAIVEQARQARSDGNFEEAASLTEEAYYLTAHSVPGEIRAVWHRPNEQSDLDVEMTVCRFRDAGFNQILIETNYEGFANAQRCVHDFLPIRPEYQNGFDVIDSFIRAGKKHGMQIHAWYENFFFGVKGTDCAMARLHPEWMAMRKDGGLLHDAFDDFYFLNPALPEVRELLVSLCRELLEQYDFDGLQLDYIRYPVGKGIDRTAGFDPKTKELLLAETGIRLDAITTTECEEWKRFTDWRAEKVTSYVASIHDMIANYRANGRNIILSTAVFGDPYEAIRLKCQNWQYWVKQGWLDAIYPMAYLNDASDIEEQIAYMVTQYGESPNISGIAPMYNHLPMIESTKQVEACRRAGASGIAFFETRACTDAQLARLKRGVFRRS